MVTREIIYIGALFCTIIIAVYIAYKRKVDGNISKLQGISIKDTLNITKRKFR